MEEAIKEFYNYSNPYLDIHSMMHLKQKHTLRVVNYCEMLAKSINLPEEDIELAKLIGLLHDIGRFEQWKRFETFNDRASIDHATLGVEVLKENDYIRKYNPNPENDNLIYSAVEYHNKYMVPEDLTERERLFTNIIRDADKLDILYLYETGEIKNKTENETISDLVFNTLKNKKIINLQDKTTKADSFGVVLGYFFDLNYSASYKNVEERQIVDIIVDIQKEVNSNLEFHKQIEELRETVKTYIKERTKC